MSGCSTAITCIGSRCRPPAPGRPKPRPRRSTGKWGAGSTLSPPTKPLRSRPSSPICSNRRKGLEAGRQDGHTGPRAGEGGFRMIVRTGNLGAAPGIFICLQLATCAGTTTVRWVKTGSNEEAIARELRDCNQQASSALASERGINQDINATLGRNWQLGGTLGIEDQAMSEQAAGYADQILHNCMRGKRFNNAS